MTTLRLFDAPRLVGALIALLVLPIVPAHAGSTSDYCRLFTKDDIEKTLNTKVTNVRPWPMKVVLGAQGTHNQSCVFEAGSRVLRITVTEAETAAEAEQAYNSTVSGQSIMSSVTPTPLPEVADEAVFAANTVVLRRQNLVVNFSVADFGSDNADCMARAKAMAAKVVERLAIAGS